MSVYLEPDITTARLTLTIAGEVGSLPTDGSCSFPLAISTSNLMQLCCSDMAMPCYTQIKFRGVVVATDESPCVIYSPAADRVTGILQLSYSVCTQTEYDKGNDCTVQKGTCVCLCVLLLLGFMFLLLFLHLMPYMLL